MKTTEKVNEILHDLYKRREDAIKYNDPYGEGELTYVIDLLEENNIDNLVEERKYGR